MPVFNEAISYLFDKFSVSIINNVTHIPISTLYRYKASNFIPDLSRYNTLFNRYRVVQYTSLRAAGASSAQASRYKGASPSKVGDVVRKYQETAIRLATEYDLDYSTIVENMAKSDKDSEEIWESP